MKKLPVMYLILFVLFFVCNLMVNYQSIGIVRVNAETIQPDELGDEHIYSLQIEALVVDDDRIKASSPSFLVIKIAQYLL